jgi:hypothetical protein
MQTPGLFINDSYDPSINYPGTSTNQLNNERCFCNAYYFLKKYFLFENAENAEYLNKFEILIKQVVLNSKSNGSYI